MNAGFPGFFQAVHGFLPFPWQERLAQSVSERGEFPRIVTVPTGCGKTSLLDIAVWALATGVRTPRRIVYCVDRRLVVDGVHLHARRLVDAINTGDDPALAAARSGLADLGGEVPLTVARLRGGMPAELHWVRHPAQPAILVTTVDQLGSRFLFRGYGVSPGMRPVHAGLLGEDALIVLDEAHLSKAMTQTLDRVRTLRGESALGLPWSVVEMTATPSRAGEAFQMGDADRAHPLLAKRLNAGKLATLVETDSVVKTCIAEARAQMRALCEYGPAPVVGIVVNTVAAARDVHLGLAGHADAVLLTGRIRPHERDQLVERYLPRMRAGRSGDDNPRPLFVVATQTIEVGADLDFDGLVSELAALDALRQRFGRLNRLGSRATAPAAIVCDESVEKPLVYGDAATRTWKRLKSIAKRKVVDFGLSALQEALPGMDDPALLTPAQDACVLMPAHMDLLVQTLPAPSPDPYIPAYLHGVETSAHISVVWRADLPESNEQQALEVIQLLPPVTAEALELPIGAARRWLMHRDAVVTDIEGVAELDHATTARGERVLRRRGGEWQYAPVSSIRPGDLLVLQSRHGGHDAFGWAPDDTRPVADIAEPCAMRVTGRAVLRLHPSLPGSRMLAGLADRLEDDPAPVVARELLDELLARADLDLDPDVRARAEALRGRPLHAVPYPGLRGLVISAIGERRLLVDDGNDSLSRTVRIPLESHCRGVGDKAHEMARNLGLCGPLVADLALAGALHDLGKADPRFQSLLGAGDMLLAKSPGGRSAREARMAQAASGYPRGQRHEAYSVVMAAEGAAIVEAHDPDLVLHLVGTHHGYGRPLWPAIEDEGAKMDFDVLDEVFEWQGAHNLDRLAADWVERWWRVVRRYGWWGTALLETVVRLADHRRSEDEAAAPASVAKQADQWAA